MPTKHDPPRPKDGEPRKDGRASRRNGRPAGRSKPVNPARLRVVADLMRTTNHRHLAAMLSKRWGVSERTIRNYRAMVIRELRATARELWFDEEVERLLTMQQLEDLRVRAKTKGELRTELHVIRTRALITGVMQPQTIAPVVNTAVVVAPAADPADAARLELARRLARTMLARTQAPSATTQSLPAPRTEE